MYVGHHYAHTHTHTHTHTTNVNKTCALQQTTDKTGTKNRLCEIDVNIRNGVIFFKTSRTILHRNTCAYITFAVFMAYTISMHIITT